MGRAGRALLAAGVLATAAAVAVLPQAASAATTFTSTSYFVNKTDRTVIAHGPSTYTAVLSTDIVLRGKESRRVTDHLGVTLTNITDDDSPVVDNRISCSRPGGTPTVRSAGTNYVQSEVLGSELVLTKSVLLTADTAGTYTCTIEVQTDDKHNTYTATVNPSGLPFASIGTYFTISAADEVGSQSWDNDTCETNGLNKGQTAPGQPYTLKCRYLGGAGYPLSFDVFADGEPAELGATWTADPGATSIDVAGTFMVTSCPDGTHSCTGGPTGPGFPSKPHVAQVASYLQVNQLYPNHSVCRIHQSNDPASSNMYYISDDRHHFPITYDVSTPVSQNCGGSRMFSVQVHFGLWNGNPVKLDGGNLDAINTVKVTTATVPDVSGATEAQAVATLRAAGFVPSVINRVMAPVPPGTVWSENSPGGAVEPAGSTVDLEISLGQARVPNVRGWDETSAEQAVVNAGLVVGRVSSNYDCADPNNVEIQNPSGNVLVLPGTVVDLTISRCTTGGGGGGGQGGGGGGEGPPRRPK